MRLRDLRGTVFLLCGMDADSARLEWMRSRGVLPWWMSTTQADKVACYTTNVSRVGQGTTRLVSMPCRPAKSIQTL